MSAWADTRPNRFPRPDDCRPRRRTCSITLGSPMFKGGRCRHASFCFAFPIFEEELATTVRTMAKNSDSMSSIVEFSCRPCLPCIVTRLPVSQSITSLPRQNTSRITPSIFKTYPRIVVAPRTPCPEPSPVIGEGSREKHTCRLSTPTVLRLSTPTGCLHPQVVYTYRLSTPTGCLHPQFYGCLHHRYLHLQVVYNHHITTTTTTTTTKPMLHHILIPMSAKSSTKRLTSVRSEQTSTEQ